MRHVLSSGSWLEIDLLRQRREQSGQQLPAFVPVRSLIVKGILIGALFPSLIFLVVFGFRLKLTHLVQQANDLAPLAEEHDLLQIQIKTEESRLATLVNTNQSMAKAMSDVRSSSALLAELRRLVPKAMTFDQATINGNMLELKGDVFEPNGLRTVNALMLSLAQSRMFQGDGVLLKEANLQTGQDSDQPNAKKLVFVLSAAFAPNAPQAIRPQLESLGAIGLDWRLRRLEEEMDLLP